MKKTHKKHQISLFFFIFSVGCVVTFIILDLLFYSYNIKQRLMDNAVEITNQKEKQFLKEINTTNNMLTAIKESSQFKEYMLYPDIFKKNIADMFLLLTKHDKNIMQLRYLDKNGIEKIRVDRINLKNKPILVQKEKLQDKSNRYYFKDSVNKKEDVWYSDLDLNIENGKVQIPYNPTLRIMLPIKTYNEFNGVLIINYHMQQILNDIVEIPSHDLMIMNDKGYSLIHFDKNKSWSYYQNPKRTVKDDFPEYFEQIIASIDYFQNNDLVAKKINLDLPQKLFFIIKINTTYLNDLKKDRYLHYLLLSVIILTLSLIMSTVFSKYLRQLFTVLKDTKSLNKLLNRKVKQQTQELVKSKEQLNNLILNLNDFIWETNDKGEYTYLSPQVKSILGYSPEELLGKSPFFLMPPNEKEKIEKLFLNIVKNAKSIEQLKNKNIHKSGHIIYLETSGNPIFDKDNKVIGYRGSDRDITQKVNSQKLITENYKKIDELNKNLEEQVHSEVEKNQEKDIQLFAQSKMAAMGDMIANIAHQWRQPLSTISTAASGVKLKEEFKQLNPEILHNDMDIIVERTQYLSQIIDTFMNFLKEKKVFQYISTKDTIQKSIDMIDSSLKTYFIVINTNFDTFDDVEINTVPSELQEVLINILNNAKDALKEKDILDKNINIEVSKMEEQLVITIEDNGGGIPDEIIDRIFEPYFTTKHESQGTGLGLHMSYRVITESLHGKITVTNGKEGAIFTIKIPID